MIKNTTFVACLGVISLLASFVYAQGGYGPMGPGARPDQSGIYYDRSAGYQPRDFEIRKESAAKRMEQRAPSFKPGAMRKPVQALDQENAYLGRKNYLH